MSYKQRTLEQRYEIYGLLHTNLSKSEIPNVVFINKRFIVISNATVDCAVTIPGKRPKKLREDTNKRPNRFGSPIG